MKLQQMLCVCLAIALPIFAHAEIYKWKEKNGTVRYSDTPPPSTSIKVDRIGNTGKDTLVKPRPSTVEAEDVAQPVSNQNKALPKEIKDPVIDPEVEAARERAKKAEFDKKNNQAKAEEEKVNQQNCQAAKSRYQTYSQGGRILSVNEKGERVFLGDEELAANKAKAQAEVNQYCK
jgi:hypothetical protein